MTGRHRAVAVPARFCTAVRRSAPAAGAGFALLLAVAAAAAAQQPTGAAAPVRLAGRGLVPVAAPDAVVDAPEADPGSIVSVIVRVPDRATRASADFVVVPSARVRLFGPASGALARDGRDAVLPVAFATPRDQPPGTMYVAQLTVRWPDGTTWHADVRTRVRARHALRLRLDSATVLLQRGRSTPIGFTLVNAGNAADTVDLGVVVPADWEVHAPRRLVIEPGAPVTGELTVTAPAAALLGETRVLHVIASGAGSDATGNVQAEVGSGLDEASPWLNMPATLTVGVSEASADGAAPLAFGLDAAGPVGAGADATVTVRHAPLHQLSPVLHRYLGGPAVRIGVRRGDDRVGVGDLMVGGAPLAGPVAQGQGVAAQMRLGAVSTDLYAARPRAPGVPASAGALLHAAAELPIGSGTAGVRVADLERPFGLDERTERTSLITARYATRLRQPLTASAEAGLMRVEDAAGRTAAGAALDMNARYARGALDVSARLRRVPGAVSTSGPAIDESFLSAAVDLGRDVTLNGWAARNDYPLLDGAGARYDGAALGVRWRRRGASAQLGARFTETAAGGFFGADVDRRSITFGGSAPVGPVVVDGTVELGRSRVRAVERPLRSVLARASWQHGPLALWLGTAHTSGLFAASYHRTDAGTSLRTRRIDVDAGIGANMAAADARARATTAWASTTARVDAQTSLVFGLDYARWNALGGGTRVSFGARRAFALPLPLRRRPVAAGTVFDDRNGDLVRDADEPPLPHVRIRRGAMVATSDEHGAFAFRGDAGATAPLRVDVASLPPGLLVPPEAVLASEGRVDVPVHRAAALRLELFDDVDADGVRDGDERASAAALVLIVDERGRTRSALADSTGTIRFRALSPGLYRVRAPGAGNDRAGDPRTLTVRLEPGGAATLEVPVPVRVRAIRFRGPPSLDAGGNGGAQPAPAVPAAGAALPPVTAGTRPR